VSNKILFLVRFHDHECKTPLTTKSLDNIFARQLMYGTEERGSPFLWRDATRSEEQLYHASHAFPGATRPANKASRFSGAQYVAYSVLLLFLLNFCRKVLVSKYATFVSLHEWIFNQCPWYSVLSHCIIASILFPQHCYFNMLLIVGYNKKIHCRVNLLWVHIIMWDLRLLWWWSCWLWSSGIWHHVVL
jgi:hypothetical protein